MFGWTGCLLLDLVITLDDATSAIYSAFLVEEEGTASTFRGLAEVIARHGLFMRALHRSRQPLFPDTHGGRQGLQDPADPGRPGAAPAGRIGHIAAYSAQARGRCERAFRTLQDRLPKELKLAGIDNVVAANRHLREVYLAEHNASFAVSPEQPASAFVPAPAELWQDLLCVQEERQVGNDNCVRWQGRVLQIPPSPLRPHFVRTTVRLHQYPDGSLAIFNGPHRLAAFPPPAAARRCRTGCVTTGRDPVGGFVDSAPPCPQPHRHHHSGQLTRYKNRTT